MKPDINNVLKNKSNKYARTYDGSSPKKQVIAHIIMLIDIITPKTRPRWLLNFYRIGTIKKLPRENPIANELAKKGNAYRYPSSLKK